MKIHELVDPFVLNAPLDRIRIPVRPGCAFAGMVTLIVVVVLVMFVDTCCHSEAA